MVEVIVTVAVLGILTAIGMSTFGNVIEGSRDTVASNLISTLNKATREFSHANNDLFLQGLPNSASDEEVILMALQYQATAELELIPKGPFMNPNWIPAASSATTDYRAQWTGSSWKLLRPDDTGAGLLIVFDGSDLGTPRAFPPGYTLPVSY